MSFAAVLDPSAVAAYARGSEAVGELLTMMAEEDRRVALPTGALAEAFRDQRGELSAMLRLLASHQRVAAVPLDLMDVEPVGLAARVVSVGVAHAAVVARSTDAYVVTTSAKNLAGLVDEDLIIEI